MTSLPARDLPDNPKLAGNIIHFARALRKAGLPIGPGRTLDAIRAVNAVGFSERRDFYWTLHACFVSRPEQARVFAQLFRLYWRDPRYLEHMMSLMLPSIRGVQEERLAQAAEKRAAEALLDGTDPPQSEERPQGGEEDLRLDIDASMTMSRRERLRSLDFEQMSTAEVAAAKRILATMTLPVPPLISRRRRSDPRGREIDMRALLRSSARSGSASLNLPRKSRRERWPNLVVLCDISGSMSQYSRMVLHFLHAVSNAKGAGWADVHGFTFGTRLTNITRHLRHRDVDAALAAAGAEAQDWEGGTRIGEALRGFNRNWSRRVLGQGAVVLLITDGLDRDDTSLLAQEAARLQRSCRQLIWLNPLLRWEGFAPKASGIRALLPHVHVFRAGHSIASLEDLAAAISNPSDVGDKDRFLRAMAAQ